MKVIGSIIIFLLTIQVCGQRASLEYPEVGKPIPDFTLHNLKFYDTPQRSLKDFRGQHFILDFWNKYCGACIRSFPKVNEMYKKFKGKLTIISVAKSEQGIEQMYERFRKRYDLSFPVAFDSALYNRFVFAGAPHLIWIDHKGVVQAITISDLTEENIIKFLSGAKFEFEDRSFKATQNRDNYDESKPFLVDSNGGPSQGFSFRSLLANNRPGMATILPWNSISETPSIKEGRFEISGSIANLLRVAFFSRPFWTTSDSIYTSTYLNPQLFLADSSMFRHLGSADLFTYSLTVPPKLATEAYIMQWMQDDFEKYFQWDMQIEEKECPYWRIGVQKNTATEVRPNRGAAKVTGDDGVGYSCRNCDWKDFYKIITKNIYDGSYPILDETGLSGAINLDVNAVMTDREAIAKELQKAGFTFQLAYKKFKVLVVKEKPNMTK